VSAARTTTTGYVGHVWAGVPALAGEHSRAVCNRCQGVRHARPVVGGHIVEFSRDGIVWGEHFACAGSPAQTAQTATVRP